MSLWIRSQDRLSLIEVKNVFCNTTQNEIVSVFSEQPFKTKIILGIYDTKERMMEVMDDIQSKLFNSNKLIVQTKYPCHPEDLYKMKMDFEGLNGVTATVHDISTSVTPMNQEGFIYEMPKE